MTMIIEIKEITLQIVNQINHLINPPNQNMNDENGGNNPPDEGQNNIIAQALIALA